MIFIEKYYEQQKLLEMHYECMNEKQNMTFLFEMLLVNE
jgi:hypothetical protein